jgi:hypothetical protein
MARSQQHLRRYYDRDSSSKTGHGGYPRGKTKPTVAGTATVGETLTGTNGTFSGGVGDITITRQWVRQDATTGAQEVIEDETAATYDLVEADEGSKIVFQNTGTDENDKATVSQSAPTAAVAEAEEP